MTDPKQIKDVLDTTVRKIIEQGPKSISARMTSLNVVEGHVIMPNIRVCAMHGCLMKRIGEGRYVIFQCKTCKAEVNAEHRKHDDARRAIESEDAIARSNIPRDFLDCASLNGAEYFKQMEARKAVKRFFDTNKRGCVMVGGVGTGKTQLACYFMQRYIERGHSGYYTTLFDIITAIKDTWQLKTSTQAAMDFFARPDVLIIDEVDDNYGTTTEYLHISRIINRRTADLKKTIVIGNESIESVANVIGDKAMDRLMEGQDAIYFDKWDSYRQKGKAGK